MKKEGVIQRCGIDRTDNRPIRSIRSSIISMPPVIGSECSNFQPSDVASYRGSDMLAEHRRERWKLVATEEGRANHGVTGSGMDGSVAVVPTAHCRRQKPRGDHQHYGVVCLCTSNDALVSWFFCYLIIRRLAIQKANKILTEFFYCLCRMSDFNLRFFFSSIILQRVSIFLMCSISPNPTNWWASCWLSVLKLPCRSVAVDKLASALFRGRRW